MTAETHTGPPERDSRERLARVMSRVAAVAGAFSVVVAALLLVNHYGVPPQDPLKSKAITEAKERLRAAPRNEQLKQQIRDLDLHGRQRYSRHLATDITGAWLLLAGTALFAFAAQKTVALRKRPPMPPLASIDAGFAPPGPSPGRWAVLATTAAVLGLLLAITAGTRVLVPDRSDDLARILGGPGAATPDSAGPTLEETLANWPRFRGPHGDGVTQSTNVPATWNVATGEGIVWKSEVPVRGFSSPVVWSNRVFVTGGDEKAREVLCYDAESGAVVWRKPVPTAPQFAGKKIEVPEQTGYAASTGATDGRRFFVVFATGDLAALDFAGNIVWSQSLGLPENPYGFATSLLVWQGRLVLQFDQGEAEAGKSRLYAFEAATGRVIWEQRRAVPSSWATPIVIEAAGRQQIITLGQPWLIAYDFASGEELWRVECLGSDLAPSPIFAGGLVFAVSAGKKLTAIRPDGQGDVTKTHVAWVTEDNIPDITSPASNGELVFLATSDGTLACLDAKSGAKVWEQALDVEFNASPSVTGERLLLFSTKGVAITVAIERTFRELSRASLEEEVHASPALVGDRMFVRGMTNLFCLGARAGASAHAH